MPVRENVLQSFGSVRAVDAETHRVTSVISTGGVARDEAVIEAAGWQFGNYDRNPVVLWQHNAEEPPFARTVEHLTSDSELVARAEFDPDDEFGMSIFRKIQAGFINATSVRWLPLAFEWREAGKGKDKKQTLHFTSTELLEWSFVTIPADPSALIIRLGSGATLDLDAYRSPAEPTGEVPDLTPKVEPARTTADYTAVADLLERYAARADARRSPEDMTIDALAKATGKTSGGIRRLIKGE